MRKGKVGALADKNMPACSGVQPPSVFRFLFVVFPISARFNRFSSKNFIAACGKRVQRPGILFREGAGDTAKEGM